jgi:spermidine/putrescine transport system permease protein
MAEAGTWADRRLRAKGAAALLTALVWAIPIAFVAVPIVGLMVFSFWRKVDNDFVPDFSLANYVRWLTDPAYLQVFSITVQMAAGVALVGLLVGYPIAYLVTRVGNRMRAAMLALLVAPLFMSYIIKLYALRGLLGTNGYLARLAATFGIDLPVGALLFNQTSVFLTMVLIYLPFVVLPVYASLEKIPATLVHAAADLGARSGQIFWRIMLPLSLPGAAVGGMFTFILALGDFVTPQMMGGTRGLTFGRLVWSQFGLAYEWPFGAALAVMILLVALVMVMVAGFVSRRFGVTL